MELTNKTIKEIALEMPATTRIFEEFKIDYCCGGNRNFKEACETAGISPDLLEEKILDALEYAGKDFQNDFGSSVSPSKLIDHIIETHHKFTKEEIGRLIPLLAKVVRKHGEQHTELAELQNVFGDLCDELIPHMQKEELVLFPHIKKLQVSEITNVPAPSPPFGTVQNPIRMMSMEHDAAGDLLREMRDLTNDYTPPENACPSYRALFFGLEELEKDLHRHIHLENNILFPLAIEMEEKSMQVFV